MLHSEKYMDQPPAEVYASLLSQGIYLASIRTMYRILAACAESVERRRQRPAMSHAVPSLTASGPNQVWSWDITKMAGPQGGVFYCAYVVMDLFSRYIVGSIVAEQENAHLATAFIRDTLTLQGQEASSVTIHCDRGAPMRSISMAALCVKLGVVQSFSRPRVSNDNPYSESLFKTLKVQPEYPQRFGSLSQAQAYVEHFVHWVNNEHHHEGLALFTPADVFHGRVTEVAARRQTALNIAYEKHPERFVRGRPNLPLPPAQVHINGPPPSIPASEPPPEASLARHPQKTHADAHSAGQASPRSSPEPRAVELQRDEHGEDCEKATLTEASTFAS